MPSLLCLCPKCVPAGPGDSTSACSTVYSPIRDLLLRKKSPLKMLLLADRAPGSPEPWCSQGVTEVHAVSTPAAAAPRSLCSGHHSALRSYYLRNTCRQAAAARDSDPRWQRPLKTFWKDSAFRMHEEHLWFVERGQNVSLNRVWRKLVPTLMDGLEGSRSPQPWWRQHENWSETWSLKTGLDCCHLGLNWHRGGAASCG